MEGSFRDRLSTVSEQGKRLWVYAKKPHGTLTNYRSIVAYTCIVLLFAVPFIKVNGYPLLLLNILERKFVVFGNVFWPQDFYILAFALLTFFVFIILFTAIFGRVWCGWACPQTVFMEMVFRKIEYFIEGDYNQQHKLDAQPWNLEKILKKGGKLLVFALFSYAIGNLVMCYLVGYENVYKAITTGPLQNWAAFWGVIGFSSIFFFVFTYFREQACTIVCPYGRLQGVLLSKSTVVVAYDNLRGEPRGKLGTVSGSCIDCKLCVHVCPTGIDIRNGTQLECINCTACIDACDEVMDKTHQPRGLIRFDSLVGILNGEKWRLTPRIYFYSVFLLALLVSLTVFLWSRKNVEATLMRVKGQTFQMTNKGTVANYYNLQMINKSFEKVPLELKISGLDHVKMDMIGGQTIVLQPESLTENVFMVEVPENDVHARKNTLKLEIYSNGKLLETEKVSFLGPMK